MTVNSVCNIILPFAAVIGMYCIAHKLKIGFLVFLLAEMSMMYIGYTTENYGFVCTAILYVLMNIYSYLMWVRDEKRRKEKI